MLCGILVVSVILLGGSALLFWDNSKEPAFYTQFSRNHYMPRLPILEDGGEDAASRDGHMNKGLNSREPPAIDTEGGLFSLIGFSSPGGAGCPADRGRVEYGVYPTYLLDEAVPYRIFLPPCYDSSDDSYPVLYLLHGEGMNEAQWDDLGADVVARTGVDAGDWEPFIIVMPRGPDPLYTRSDGGESSYEYELLAGLIPYIEDHYRTAASAQGRFLAGIGRGGVWALEIAFRHPNVFDGAAGLSPALRGGFPRSRFDTQNLASSSDRLPSRIYLAAFFQDAAWSQTETLHMALNDAGAIHTFRQLSGDRSVESWRTILQEVYAFFASAPTDPSS